MQLYIWRWKTNGIYLSASSIPLSTPITYNCLWYHLKALQNLYPELVNLPNIKQGVSTSFTIMINLTNGQEENQRCQKLKVDMAIYQKKIHELE